MATSSISREAIEAAGSDSYERSLSASGLSASMSASAGIYFLKFLHRRYP